MNKIRKEKPTGRKARREIEEEGDEGVGREPKKLGVRDYVTRKPKGVQQKREKN